MLLCAALVCDNYRNTNTNTVNTAMPAVFLHNSPLFHLTRTGRVFIIPSALKDVHTLREFTCCEFCPIYIIHCCCSTVTEWNSSFYNIFAKERNDSVKISLRVFTTLFTTGKNEWFCDFKYNDNIRIKWQPWCIISRSFNSSHQSHFSSYILNKYKE